MKIVSMKSKTKDMLEKLFIKERKEPKDIAKILNWSVSFVEEKIKFYRLDKSRVLLDKGKAMEKSLKKKRTKAECKRAFRKLKRKIKRTPMLKEMPTLDPGLRRDILRHWGSFAPFLTEGRFGKPRPLKGSSNQTNFARLASETAIRYHQKGKWSRSEHKVARILEKMGLLENLDFWHNFKLKSPFKGTFELDFYLPKWKLVIECDSFWHELGESKAKDKVRDQWVQERLDCKTTRFDKFNQTGLAKIRKALRKEVEDKK